jgi:hypothetical protein
MTARDGWPPPSATSPPTRATDRVHASAERDPDRPRTSVDRSSSCPWRALPKERRACPSFTRSPSLQCDPDPAWHSDAGCPTTITCPGVSSHTRAARRHGRRSCAGPVQALAARPLAVACLQTGPARGRRWRLVRSHGTGTHGLRPPTGAASQAGREDRQPRDRGAAAPLSKSGPRRATPSPRVTARRPEPALDIDRQPARATSARAGADIGSAVCCRSGAEPGQQHDGRSVVTASSQPRRRECARVMRRGLYARSSTVGSHGKSRIGYQLSALG